MSEVVIVEAVRTPVGRRGGGLSTIHPVDLLAQVQQELFRRAGVNPADIGQVVGGCVSQVGEQSFNVTRTAWLTAGLPLETAATTVDSQCGSSQQATNLATSLVAAGVVDAAVGCGVESMSRIPIGSNSDKSLNLGRAVPRSYFANYEFTSQFEGAERIADKWGLSRADCDAFGLQSQQRAARAWAEDRFATQVMPVTVPVLDDDGKPTGESRTIARDEGMRDTNAEGLTQLKPVARPDGVHTAGSSSQISDGSGAVLLMERAQGRGARPHAPRPGRRHLPRRLRSGAHAHRADRRHPPALRADGPRHRRHGRRGDQRGVRLGRPRLGQGDQPRHGEGQPERWRHRAGPPTRRHRVPSS